MEDDDPRTEWRRRVRKDRDVYQEWLVKKLYGGDKDLACRHDRIMHKYHVQLRNWWLAFAVPSFVLDIVWLVLMLVEWKWLYYALIPFIAWVVTEWGPGIYALMNWTSWRQSEFDLVMGGPGVAWHVAMGGTGNRIQDRLDRLKYRAPPTGAFARYWGWAHWGFCILLFVAWFPMLGIAHSILTAGGSGWAASSPLGQSSCSRDPNLLDASVGYNPNGYYPRQSQNYVSYEPDQQVNFPCRITDARWAPDTGQPIQGCVPNTNTNPVSLNCSASGQLPTRIDAKYPNGGTGIRSPYAITKLINVPGNVLTCPAVDLTDPACFINGKEVSSCGSRECRNNPDCLLGHRGYRICYDCFSYDYYVTDPGVVPDGYEHCEAREDRARNPFCAFCPGTKGNVWDQDVNPTMSTVVGGFVFLSVVVFWRPARYLLFTAVTWYVSRERDEFLHNAMGLMEDLRMREEWRREAREVAEKALGLKTE